jgi:hypothetical protein
MAAKKSRQMKFFGVYFSRLPYIGARCTPGGIGAQREPHPHAGKPSERLPLKPGANCNVS